MDRTLRSRMVGGVVLILIGLWALAVELVPSLNAAIYSEHGWPLAIVGAGLLLAVLGFFVGAPGMAIPACIVGGIGGLLYWQNATGNWESWAYAWALIPGFVGVGIIFEGMFELRARTIRAGAWLVLVSLVLFFALGSLLGGFTLFGPYWPVLLIVLGLVVMIRRLVR